MILLVVTHVGKCVSHLLYIVANAFSFHSNKIQELQQGGVTDEAEPFMGSGRFGN